MKRTESRVNKYKFRYLFTILTGVQADADDVVGMDDAVIDIEKALTNALVNRVAKVGQHYDNL